MTLLKTLYNLYQANEYRVGIEETRAIGKGQKIFSLMPFLYVTQNSHMVIQLTLAGKPISHAVRKESISIPVSPTSMVRTSSSCAHPVVDKLKYTGNDLHEYNIDNNDDWADFQEKLAHYSDFHPYFQAIQHFYQQHKITELLASWNILRIEDGEIMDKKSEKEGGEISPIWTLVEKIEDFVITFEVFDEETGEIFTLLSPSVYKAHEKIQKDMFSKDLTKGYCYILGEEAYLIKKHPKNIRKGGDSTKLISTPSNKNLLTFQGKFGSAEDAFQCSVEVSIKAHNMLTYLIQRFGKSVKERIYLLAHIGGNRDELEKVPQVDSLFQFFKEEIVLDMQQDETLDTTEHISHDIARRLNGYMEKLPTIDGEFLYLVLDSTDGKGRLSILDNVIFTPKEYKAILSNWHHASAVHPRWLNKGIPSFYSIIITAFDKIELSRSFGRYLKVYHELQMAVINGDIIPQTFLKNVYRRAIKQFMIEKENRDDTLWIFMSMMQYNLQVRGGDILETRTRSYIFGELVALAEIMEENTQYADKKRATNAARHVNRLIQRPSQTWFDLTTRLIPYWDKLKKKYPKSYVYYREEIDRLILELDSMQGLTNQPLDERFLVGYSYRKTEYRKFLREVRTNKEGVMEHDNEEN